jgi:leucyl aminopeptidase
MEILVEQGSVTEVGTPLLAVNLFDGVKQPGGATGAVDSALGGLISQLIADGEIKGSLNEVTIIHTQGKLPAQRIAVVGLGKQEKFDLDAIRRASGSLFKKVRDSGLKSYCTVVHGAGSGGFDSASCGQAIVEGAMLAGYGYHQFKTMAPAPGEVERLTFVEMDGGKIPQIEAGVRKGQLFAASAITARDLASGPPNLATPEFIAERARELAARYGLECRVLGPDEMKDLGMGAILAVGQGSIHPPRFIALKYSGDPDSQKLLGLVGKGITFDSGGISIKPSQNMDRMKYDKSGAATVLGTMQGIAELKVKANVLGVIAAAENLPGGNAYRPGDIVRAMNGKTIEVISTDAEGRLVLADALSYAVQQGADTLVDIATLTGGVKTALGTGGAGVMGNDEALIQQLREAGDLAGERLWQLPIWEDYLWEQVRSEFADIKNSGGAAASPSTGALFLSLFVGNARWAHLDIAGTAWVDRDQPSLPKSYIPRGATGFGTRLLLEFVQRQEQG